ncbi:MAG TPA: response regulator [Dongiaceae bacterium]|nr:response regulator [Dongiaceae bacterium]
MMLLVDSLLTYTELQSGNLQLDNRPFATRDLVASSRTLFTELSQKKGIALNFYIEESTPDVLISDCVRLGQILNNLLDNAVKFTRHGRVEVRIQGQADIGANGDFQLIMQVSDTGIGIAEDKLALIFERFRQVDGSFNRGYGGLGIGLAVIKSLLDFMGGSIAVESALDRGTTFTVHVPCRHQAQGSENLTPALQERPPNSLRLLVVEDNPVNQLVLKGLLQKQGYTVMTADNGALAVELVSNMPVDAILMDCQMPVLDGFEATRQIRALPLPVSQVPIIAVTANAMSQDRERCLEAGMNDYTSKPIDARALNKKIIYWVNLPTKTQKAG